MLCLVCWYTLTRCHKQTILTASCWWSMGLALHKSPAHVGLSCVPFLDHSYLHHPKGSVIGSGQAPKAQCSWLYSSCHRAPSLSILHMVSHHQTLWSSYPSRFLQAASSSCSCLRIHSRVAWAASFSFSQAASLIRMSPMGNSGEGTTAHRGGLEVASEYVTVGPWRSSCIVTAGECPDSIQVLACLSPCCNLPMGGEGVDHPLPALTLSAIIPANP